MLSKIASAALAVSYATAASTQEWKARNIYQVLTDRFAKSNQSNDGPCTDLSNYCGGSWKGIQNNLDYIAGMGFDAIWISPVVDNFGNGYHGYWAANWEKRNDHFGSDDDLKALVNAAHAKGMYVMVDVVANHVAPIGMDFSKIYPLNQASHYHNDCQINDWGNQWQVENCRLADLPDLNQGDSYVRGYLKSWIQNLVKDFGFDGIRIDTIPEVPKDFWSEYGQAAGVFQMGECFNGDTNYVSQYQGPVSAVFNYPMYFTIKDVFGSQKTMYNIKNRFIEEQGKFQDVDALGIFVDNHDNARFLNQYNDVTRFKSALLFAQTARGIPFFYYGSEQAYRGGNDPQNRESLWQAMNPQSDIYKFTAAINNARKAHQIWNHPMQEQYVMDNLYCFSRGEFLVAVTNSNNAVQVTVPNTPFADGTTVCNIFYPTTDCQKVTNKSVNVYLANGESKIYVPQGSAALNNSEYAFLQN